MGQFDPIKHSFTIDADRVKELLTQGVQLSERVAKLLYAKTQEDVYKKFFTLRISQSKTKNPDKHS